MEGIKSLDGKLDRTDLNNDDQIEEVMKKSDEKRQYLKKRPSESKNNTESNSDTEKN